MNTLENNKLLADFFGGKYKNQTNIPLNDNEIWLPKFGVCHLGNNGKVLKFHSDWNWLMEVVEKIDGLCRNTGFEIYSRYVHIRVNNNLTISSNVCNSKREAVYKACVEFVKWYNEQKN
jgi:hypothetical protein